MTSLPQVTRLGADVDGGVSSKTDILVHGVQTSHNARSTKLKKALTTSESTGSFLDRC